MEHATKDCNRPTRSYGTTPASCKETKPRDANKILKNIIVF